MSIYALQSLAGGFLDEDLEHFNKIFDDWCIQFDSYEDAMNILQTLENEQTIDIVEITPLSYPKYFLILFKVQFIRQEKLIIRLFVLLNLL